MVASPGGKSVKPADGGQLEAGGKGGAGGGAVVVVADDAGGGQALRREEGGDWVALRELELADDARRASEDVEAGVGVSRADIRGLAVEAADEEPVTDLEESGVVMNLLGVAVVAVKETLVDAGEGVGGGSVGAVGQGELVAAGVVEDELLVGGVDGEAGGPEAELGVGDGDAADASGAKGEDVVVSRTLDALLDAKAREDRGSLDVTVGMGLKVGFGARIVAEVLAYAFRPNKVVKVGGDVDGRSACHESKEDKNKEFHLQEKKKITLSDFFVLVVRVWEKKTLYFK